MSKDPQSQTGPRPHALNRFVPHLVSLIIILVMLAIPVRIIRQGFLPDDDALRYAAKALTGKSWSEIMVIGVDYYTVDHNFGYDLLLRQVHLLTHWDAEKILDVTLFGLFVLLAVSALPWLKRPEAWLGALLICGIGWPPLAARAMIGRPLLLTAFGMLTVFFVWHRRNTLKPDWRVVAALSGLITFTVWTHGVWYLWALPLMAFLLAGEYQWGAALLRAWGIGTVAAALLTGHPLAYLYEALLIALRSSAMHPTARTMVPEYHPISGGLLIFLIPGAILVLRRLAKLEARPLTANPIFWMAALGWLLGFVARRFWEDFGLWAMVALVACELSTFLQTQMAVNSMKRLFLTGCLAVATYLSFTSDLDSRWTRNLSRQYLVETDPELAGWLPDKGGIFYAPDSSFFYETFFKNPDAGWRYMVGFEMTLMPEDDFDTLYRIVWNNGAAAAFEPWVKKMRPEDRLFVRGDSERQPPIPALEWHYTLGAMWSGRLPRTNVPAIAPRP